MTRYLITVGNFGMCYQYADSLCAAAIPAQNKYGDLLTAVVRDCNDRHPRTTPNIRAMHAFPCPVRQEQEKEAA